MVRLNGDVIPHRSPEFTSRDVLGIQESIELIMTIVVAMIRKVRLCEVLKTC